MFSGTVRLAYRLHRAQEIELDAVPFPTLVAVGQFAIRHPLFVIRWRTSWTSAEEQMRYLWPGSCAALMHDRNDPEMPRDFLRCNIAP